MSIQETYAKAEMHEDNDKELVMRLTRKELNIEREGLLKEKELLKEPDQLADGKTTKRIIIRRSHMKLRPLYLSL